MLITISNIVYFIQCGFVIILVTCCVCALALSCDIFDLWTEKGHTHKPYVNWVLDIFWWQRWDNLTTSLCVGLNIDDINNQERHRLPENEGGAGQATDNAANGQLSRIVELMFEDRERREAEQLEERRRWEQERRVREETYKEERRRREEEMVFREEQNRRQLKLLQSLVEGVQLQGEAATKRAENDRDVN